MVLMAWRLTEHLGGRDGEHARTVISGGSRYAGRWW
jgi:hypothetical protein